MGTKEKEAALLRGLTMEKRKRTITPMESWVEAKWFLVERLKFALLQGVSVSGLSFLFEVGRGKS